MKHGEAFVGAALLGIVAALAIPAYMRAHPAATPIPVPALASSQTTEALEWLSAEPIPVKACWTYDRSKLETVAVVEVGGTIYTLEDAWNYCWRIETVRFARLNEGKYLCNNRGDCNRVLREGAVR